MIIDAHLRCTGREQTGPVLQVFDDGIDIGVLLALFLDNGCSLADAPSQPVRAGRPAPRRSGRARAWRLRGKPCMRAWRHVPAFHQH